MLEEHDERVRRCPRLGHEVTFRYCRTQEGESICPRILDCWWETFDVRGFLERHLPPEQMRPLLEGERPPKIASLVELIEQARRRAQEGGPAGQ